MAAVHTEIAATVYTTARTAGIRGFSVSITQIFLYLNGRFPVAWWNVYFHDINTRTNNWAEALQSC